MTCFARQGYHATSMDDVVRESGLSVGAIYSYFASKEDLFLALAEARSEQTLAYMNELFRSPGSIGAKSAEAVDYFFRMLSDDELLPDGPRRRRVPERSHQIGAHPGTPGSPLRGDPPVLSLAAE